MATQITNKQVKIVSNVNFNNKEIENAKIDGRKNQLVNTVNDVQIDEQSVVENNVASIYLAGGDNIFSYLEGNAVFTNFSGFGFKKQSYILTKNHNYDDSKYAQLDVDNHHIYFSYDVRISTGTLIFRNGQLLNLIDDYNIINTCNISINSILSEGDIITVINGLSILSKITNIDSNIIHCNYYINDNIIIFKNGLILSNHGDYELEQNDIRFTTRLNSNDKIVIIRCVTNIIPINVEEQSEYLNYEGPFDNIIFRNGLLLSTGMDYEIVDYLGQSTWKIKFTTPLQIDEQLLFINNEPYSIYALLGDKQNALPLYEPGKILSNDGNQLKWVDPSGGKDDGVFYPKNDEELKEIINGQEWGGTIDFGAFDWNTVDPNGYVINGKSFNIRNVSFGWVPTQFRWFKSSLFTLNNAQLWCNNFVLNVNVQYNPGEEDPTQYAPLIRVNNGTFQCQFGMIQVNQATGIDKVVIFEANNSNIDINNYAISLIGFDENKPDNVHRIGYIIESNIDQNYNSNSPSVHIGNSHLSIFGFDENHAIKYNNDIQTRLEIVRSDIDCQNQSLILPNNSFVTISYSDVNNITAIDHDFLPYEDNQIYNEGQILKWVNPEDENNIEYLKVLQQFNSHDYINNINALYDNNICEHYYNITISGILYAFYDSENKITNSQPGDCGFYLNGLKLNDHFYIRSDKYFIPINDEHLQSDNVKDAIKELANRESGGSLSQADYWQHAGVIQDTIHNISGDIIVNESIYFSQVTGDRWVSYFKYDGSNWYLGDPDEGETPTLVNLNDYGIDVSQATFDIDSSFEVYSEYLNDKSSFTVSRMITIHSVFLNGNLQLKKDYVINDHTITFNNYTLQASDSISII